MSDNFKECKGHSIEDDDLEIDLMEYVRKLWDARKMLLKAAGIGALVGLVVAFSLPRQYTVAVTLSPESGKAATGSLSGMAAMLGIGGMNMSNDADALNVTLFPDIVASTPFVLELFPARVTTLDGKLDTTLVSYLDEQQSPWWNVVLGLPGRAVGAVKSWLAGEVAGSREKTLNPFHLTGEQSAKVAALRRAISVSVDKKTGITTVSVTLQDPLVAATITDTVVVKLQAYITAYRVSKAQQDCDYLEQLYKERQQEYYAAQQQYAQYVDGNKGVILQSALTERERLQNEMTLAYQVYTQVATQLQVARAKVQEAKPVFAVVEPATVPLQASGTGKKVFLMGFVFLAVAVTSAWILFGKELFEGIRKELQAAPKE